MLVIINVLPQVFKLVNEVYHTVLHLSSSVASGGFEGNIKCVIFVHFMMFFRVSEDSGKTYSKKHGFT
jgi:hypothetical protein